MIGLDTFTNNADIYDINSLVAASTDSCNLSIQIHSLKCDGKYNGECDEVSGTARIHVVPIITRVRGTEGTMGQILSTVYDPVKTRYHEELQRWFEDTVTKAERGLLSQTSRHQQRS